jgi:ATP-dependent DNA helicase RecG
MELGDSLQYCKGVGPKKSTALARLGLTTVYDLLTYYPRAYEDQSTLTPIAELQAGEPATIAGVIVSVAEKSSARGMTILTAMLQDGSGFLSVTWFNQAFLKQKLQPGRKVFVTGKPSYAYGGRGALCMAQLTSFEILDRETDASDYCGILPVYASTAMLNQKFFRNLLRQILADGPSIAEVLPSAVRERYQLMDRFAAFQMIHFPADVSRLQAARRRLAFEELYLIQCGLMLLKKKNQEQEQGIRHLLNSQLVQTVYEALPFRLTHDQERTWQEIQTDMEKELPMRRLVQGDVGSGKTVLALLALVKTVENGYQGALMAPTEILARQHYENFTAQLSSTQIRVGFLSGHLTKKQHENILQKIARQEVDIVIGTHALIQESVGFAALGLVVTDEQHRFGIAQRAELEKKGGRAPDVLVMTATPIPRTMTLTVYGDLDVSRIEELPPGRRPIRTFVRTTARRRLIYEFVKKELLAGRQAYVVCPLIEASEEMPLPSAEEIYTELSEGVFHGIPCGLVHGRLKTREKERTMQQFHEGKIKLLVATTVIEVGVDVPNASIMVVENAERFGLAQLHQLRGRIGRGPYASYCILVTSGRTPAARQRLAILEHTASGFLLAEEDLKLRGPGQFFGLMQHGLGDLKIANVLTDTDILLQARRAAMETMESAADLHYVREVLSLQYKQHFLHITDT